MCFFLLKSNESCRRNRSLTIVFHLSCILTNGDCYDCFLSPFYFVRHGWTYGDDLSGMIQKLRFFNSNNRPCRYTWYSWRTQLVHIPVPDRLPKMPVDEECRFFYPKILFELPRRTRPAIFLYVFFTTKNSTASGDWFGYRGHRWLFSFLM